MPQVDERQGAADVRVITESKFLVQDFPGGPVVESRLPVQGTRI